MRLLIVSPIASHPQNQGNSARIHALCRGLQALGHQVHFLYYPMEGLTPTQHTDMLACWDGFHSISCKIRLPAPKPGMGYGIDDWFDPDLGAFAAALHEQWRFDAVLVNYVWISGVLDALPDDLVKIIDTHDVFGDRHKTFESVGLKPEWYYTTLAQETLALNRADIVIAIQSLEAEHLRSLVTAPHTRVVTVGYGVPARFLPMRIRRKVGKGAGPRTVGYLGSGNPFNVRSIRDCAVELLTAPDLTRHFRFVLAGSICSRFVRPPKPFELLGTVDDLHDFYCDVDIVLNPMLGGTGLKIKSLEALSFGLPLLGTDDAWAGISTANAAWPQGPAPKLVDALRTIAQVPGLLDTLRKRCQHIYTDYLATQLRTMHDLFTTSGLGHPHVHTQSHTHLQAHSYPIKPLPSTEGTLP